MAQFDRTLDLIGRIQVAQSQDAICSELLRITSDFGLTALMAGTVPDPNTPTGRQKDHVILCDWPVEWLTRYVERNYVDHDPVVQQMKRQPGPLLWQDAARRTPASRGSSAVMGDAGEFRLRDGLAFPLVTFDGAIVMVSLGGERSDFSAEQFGMISLISTYAIGRAIQLHAGDLAASPRPGLTARETECLKWAALGKSEWEISQILGISEHTSEKHLINARNKLGAANRVQAVAEAIRRGYIA